MAGAQKFDVVVIGAGPAGLAAGYELVKANRRVLIFEKDRSPGGISKTIKYKDYYFDLGGHRFFTKSDLVNALWNEVLPKEDFLTVSRLSRIFYRNRFFNYPLTPINALVNLGPKDTAMAMISYIGGKLHPIEPEDSFAAWVSNHFGRFLFNIFFKTYTEKVWGIPCDQISAEWAAQRIKKLSLFTAVLNAFFPRLSKQSVTTLINSFQYPKYGPGMMYSAMTEKIRQQGGTVLLSTEAKEISIAGGKVTSVTVSDGTFYPCDHVISTMPITELVKVINPRPPSEVLDAASELCYRSFIVVSLVVDQKETFPDNWIYIHSPDVKMGRIQNFKNWSRFMVPDENKTILGIEYFCDEGDQFWTKSDPYLIKFAEAELQKIKLIDAKARVIDAAVVRVPKAYPVYSPMYPLNLRFIRSYLQNVPNLQVAGRASMYKYNNMDHSILTGVLAARNTMGGHEDVWSINTEEEYHEESKS